MTDGYFEVAPGTSGVLLMDRYEIQVLESSAGVTYADGQAGAAIRPQGEWQAYDIVVEAPKFEGEKLVGALTPRCSSTECWCIARWPGTARTGRKSRFRCKDRGHKVRCEVSATMRNLMETISLQPSSPSR